MELPGRWKDLETILKRSSNLAGPEFEPGEHLLDFLQVRMQHGRIDIDIALDAIQRCLLPALISSCGIQDRSSMSEMRQSVRKGEQETDRRVTAACMHRRLLGCCVSALAAWAASYSRTWRCRASATSTSSTWTPSTCPI